MQDLNDKVNNGGATAAGQLSATEFNQPMSELQNVIEGVGQTLSGADLSQVGKGIAAYAAGGDYYTDSGAADAYVLSAVGSKQAPHVYFEGMRIRWIPGNASTGGSVTVNAATLGVKSVKSSAGTNPAANELNPNRMAEATYDGTDFILKPSRWDFISTPSIWAATVPNVFAHGLGSIPTDFKAFAICTTAENGYSIGDVIPISSIMNYSGTTYTPVAVSADVTNITVTDCFSGHYISRKDGTAVGTLNVANWNVFVVANL